LFKSNKENMPIEETGNMLMMIAAVVDKEGDTDWFYPHYWPLLQMWANYLVNSLPDPGNQLCTDDFEGVNSVLPPSLTLFFL
jgi:hypothetical protein